MTPRPARRAQRRARTRITLVASLVVVAFSALLLWLVVAYASQNPEQANLGSKPLQFSARRLAAEIDDRGPFLFADPLPGRRRDIYVNHVGGDLRSGWVALSAYAGRPDRTCVLRWEAAEGAFRDPCSRQTFPPTGAGLTTYPVTVEGDRVRIDLAEPQPATGANATGLARPGGL